MTFNWTLLPQPILALSPMADMTDSAFCRVVRSITGSDIIMFREMVSAEAVIRGNNKTLGMTELHKDERPLIQQLFGSEPKQIAEAARIIEHKQKPEGFDINMGCPVYKVVSSFNGASLMKDPQRAIAIVKAVKEAITVPVSVKIRTGWDDPHECLAFGNMLEKAGVDLITIHGRTKKQGYSGQSDWDLIGEFVKTVSIPVLANGDMFTPQLTIKALETTNASGVLIARGALGNPWIFKQTQAILQGQEPKPITLKERITVIKQHALWHMEQFDQGTIQTFRKHLTWYFKSIPGAKPYKQRLHTVNTLKELEIILDEMLMDGLKDQAISRRDAHHPFASSRLYISK
jgi:tRNA-dihydrouridine synthase B